MKAEVEKGCSVLTQKGFAHEGAILQAKDFSSPEIFEDLCENSGKVTILKDPEPEKEVESVKAEESKPDETESESAKDPESAKESAGLTKKKAGRPKGGAKRNK